MDLEDKIYLLDERLNAILKMVSCLMEKPKTPENPLKKALAEKSGATFVPYSA